MIAEQSRSRLMHALDVMADGFALYDANDRLVLYNRKYVDYSPLVADIIMPGAPKEEILRKSVRRGAFVLNGMAPEEYIAWRLAPASQSRRTAGSATGRRPLDADYRETHR